MNVRTLLITIAVAGFGTTGGVPQLSPADQAAVDAYRSAISAAESGRASGIEAAFSSRAPRRRDRMQTGMWWMFALGVAVLAASGVTAQSLPFEFMAARIHD